MEIAIVSDTHMPRELQAYGPVVAVQGNADNDEVRARLPDGAVVEAEP